MSNISVNIPLPLLLDVIKIIDSAIHVNFNGGTIRNISKNLEDLAQNCINNNVVDKDLNVVKDLNFSSEYIKDVDKK